MDSNPKINAPVPAFEVYDSKGNKRSTDTLRGHPFVVYFYPKDDTPGCTTEACELRDLKEELNRLNTTVIGISPDTDASHNAFIEKHNLNFPLIADTDRTLCKLFGVWEEKNSFGKKVWGVVRSTFVIDAQGIIRLIEKPVQVKGHAERVIQALSKL